jgi:hypothetical protein
VVYKIGFFDSLSIVFETFLETSTLTADGIEECYTEGSFFKMISTG